MIVLYFLLDFHPHKTHALAAAKSAKLVSVVTATLPRLSDFSLANSIVLFANGSPAGSTIIS